MSKKDKKQDANIERNLVTANDEKIKGMEKALFSDSDRVEYWFTKNWKKATVALVLIALVIVAVVFFISKHNDSKKKAADALANVTIATKGVIGKYSDHPAAPMARFRLAGQYIEKKDYKNALPLLRHIVADSKADPMLKKQAKISLAGALEASGDTAGAITLYTKLSKDRSQQLPTRIMHVSNAARLMAQSGKKADAVALINNTLKEDNGKNSSEFDELRQLLISIESGK